MRGEIHSVGQTKETNMKFMLKIILQYNRMQDSGWLVHLPR